MKRILKISIIVFVISLFSFISTASLDYNKVTQTSGYYDAWINQSIDLMINNATIIRANNISWCPLNYSFNQTATDNLYVKYNDSLYNVDLGNKNLTASKISTYAEGTNQSLDLYYDGNGIIKSQKGDFVLQNTVSDGDIYIKGNDGGVTRPVWYCDVSIPTHFFMPTIKITDLSSAEKIRLDATGGSSFFLDQTVGINVYSLTKQFEVNSANGNNMRLIYNDNDGSPSKYADFSTNSSGALIITSSFGTIGLASNNLNTNGNITSNYLCNNSGVCFTLTELNQTSSGTGGNSSWNVSTARDIFATHIGLDNNITTTNTSMKGYVDANDIAVNNSWKNNVSNSFLYFYDQRYNDTALIVSVNNSWKTNWTNWNASGDIHEWYPTSSRLDYVYSCAEGKILKRTGSIWECADDDTGVSSTLIKAWISANITTENTTQSSAWKSNVTGYVAKTGDTMSGNLNISIVNITNSYGHSIYDNSTCIVIKGTNSDMFIC